MRPSVTVTLRLHVSGQSKVQTLARSSVGIPILHAATPLGHRGPVTFSYRKLDTNSSAILVSYCANIEAQPIKIGTEKHRRNPQSVFCCRRVHPLVVRTDATTISRGMVIWHQFQAGNIPSLPMGVTPMSSRQRTAAFCRPQ